MELITAVGMIASVLQLIDYTAAVIQFVNGVKDAPKERARLATELASLLALLTDLRYKAEKISDRDPLPPTLLSLNVQNGPLDQLGMAISELEKRLKLEGKFKQITGSLKWPFNKSEVHRILLQIERLKILLILASQNDVQDEVQNIASGVARLEFNQQRQEDRFRYQARKEIITWLSPLDMMSRHREISSKRQEGTGRWILETEAFRKWVAADEKSSTNLWCCGIPGIGKSTIGSIIIDELEQEFDREDVCVVYIYFNYKDRDQTTSNVLGNILQQLLKKQTRLSIELTKMYEKHNGKGKRPTVSEHTTLLLLELYRFSRVFIIIDALDECQELDRKAFVDQLVDLPGHTHVLITSRQLSSIARQLREYTSLEISGHEADIRFFLEERMERSMTWSARLKTDTALRISILDTILAKARGMFLLAKLHVEALLNEDNLRGIRKVLLALPEELHETYEQILDRIRSQDLSKAKRANQILSWVAYSVRPLSMREIQCALAIEPEDSFLDEEAIPEEEVVLSICCGLVSLDSSTQELHLVHYSAQNYFDRVQKKHFSDAQANIASTCLTFLSFEQFIDVHLEDENKWSNILAEYPFINYVTFHWGNHVQGDSEIQLSDQIMGLLSDKSKSLLLNCALSKTWFLKAYRNPSSDQRVSPSLYLMSYFGLQHTASTLLENGEDPNFKVTKYRTPLTMAIEMGHENLAQLFLDNGADVEAKGGDGDPVLHIPIKKGYKGLVGLLVQRGANVNSVGEAGYTALMTTVRNMQKFVDIQNDHRSDDRFRELRSRSTESKHLESVTDPTTVLTRLEDWNKILSTGVSSSAYICSEKQDPGLLPHPFTQGKIINYRMSYSPNASPMGREADLMMLLLRHGANVNFRNVRGETALYWGAWHGLSSVIECLLRHGAEVDNGDRAGWTALHAGSCRGHMGVVRTLLTYGANVNQQKVAGETALNIAVYHRQHKLAEVLRAHGGKINQIASPRKATPEPLDVDIEQKFPTRVDLYITDDSENELFKQILEMDDDGDEDDCTFSRELYTPGMNQLYDAHQKIETMLRSGTYDEISNYVAWIYEQCACIGPLDCKMYTE